MAAAACIVVVVAAVLPVLPAQGPAAGSHAPARAERLRAAKTAKLRLRAQELPPLVTCDARDAAVGIPPLTASADEPSPYHPRLVWQPNATTDPFLYDHVHNGSCVLGTPAVLPVRPFALQLPRLRGMRAYNPSLARYGGGYLVSYRVDWTHQCRDVPSPHELQAQFRERRGEKHTLLVRTDDALRPLGEPRALDGCGGWSDGGARGACARQLRDRRLGVVDVRLARAGASAGVRASHAAAAAADSEVNAASDAVWATFLPVQPPKYGCGSLECRWGTHVGRLEIRDAAEPAAEPAAERGAAAATDGGAPAARGWAVRVGCVAPLCEPAGAAGRNQALIFDPGPEGRVRVQAWLDPTVTIAHLRPAALSWRHTRNSTSCRGGGARGPLWAAGAGGAAARAVGEVTEARSALAHRAPPPRAPTTPADALQRSSGGVGAVGGGGTDGAGAERAAPRGQQLPRPLAPRTELKTKHLTFKYDTQLRALRRGELDLAAFQRAVDTSRCEALRRSGTSPLVRVRAAAPHAQAAAGGGGGGGGGERGAGRGREGRERAWLLGVAHAHHQPFSRYYSLRYLHVFYLLDARPPHALVAHSDEWCLPAAASAAGAAEERARARGWGGGGAGLDGGAGSCEVVQFVSGLELSPVGGHADGSHADAQDGGGHANAGQEVVLTYGANDCVGKAARLPLGEVLGMLRWDEGALEASGRA